MANRKVVQIHRVIGPDTRYWQQAVLTTAVCDDGTVWECLNNDSWEQLPPIPQDEPDTTEGGR